MQKEINGISYTIRNTSRSRKILITVHSDRRIIVSKSPRIPIAIIEKLVAEKFSWIQNMLHKQALKPRKLLSQYSVKDYKENKERARALVTEKLSYFNKFLKLKFNSFAIRNQKTRWGSCSGKRNLNFNYKIVFLPEELADYIIVHELCHLIEMNHSKRFWALIAQIIPDYKKRQKNIRLF